ncbi:MAG: arylsulfatase [Planctomycetaceae bacterium]|nr:arylsulfatase [Planctomycetaceae bacterium]
MGKFGAALPFMALSLVATMELQAAGRAHPNVVFLIADDLGYKELGSYGQTKIRTPRLDQMATEGMRLTQHYSGNPVCATSRCVLMTGRHSGHAFIRDNREVKPEGQLPIPDDAITLAELFKQHGYATGAFGKWGLGPMDSTGDPLSQGFDRFHGYNCQRHAHNFYPKFVWDNHTRVDLEGNTRGLTGKHYAPDLYLAAALDFIDNYKDQPFFLYFPTIVPHLAIQVPDDSLNEYKGLWDDPPYDGKKGYLPHPAPRAGYAAMVTRMDSDIGQIFDRLKKYGLDEDTVIVFTSDNGPTYNRLGGSDSEFFDSAGEFRGLKGSVYEGGMRVPAIVRWPGKVPAGTVSDHLSAFYDWMPTLMDLIGEPDSTPEVSDGLSFAPELLGRSEDQKEPEFLYWEFPGYGGQQALRMGNWKAVRQGLRKHKPGTPLPLELYDLSTDISESKDISTDHPEVVKKIKELMAKAHAPSKEFPLPALDAAE